jgi:DNA-binding MarR family transcriptional regulator
MMTRTNPRQYVRIPQSLLTTDGIKASTIATYASLASFADRKGFSFPSVPSIAKRAGLSEKIARRECDRLVSLGYLERKAHFDTSEGQRSNRYTLIWQRESTEESRPTPEQNGEGTGIDLASPPSSKMDTLTRSTINQPQQSILAAEIVARSWRSHGKTQKAVSVIRLVSDALTNGLEVEKLEKALTELSRSNSYVSAYSLNAALNPKPLFTLPADRKTNWEGESERL